MGLEKLLDFVLDGLLKHSLRSLTKKTLQDGFSFGYGRSLRFELNHVVFSPPFLS